MKEQRFRKMEVWKKAMDFIEKIYKITNKFPSKEVYGLTSQLRRSATSIALNIAEGSGTGSDREFSRFLSIALRSNYELMCAMEIGVRLKYCSEQESDNVLKESDELAAMISSFMKKLKADS
jgi:four helix bundle protein